MTPAEKQALLKLLENSFEDEIAQLQLRMIRDAQQPRFEQLKQSHPEIWKDFMKARKGPHEVLLRNRRRRVEILTKLIEAPTAPKFNEVQEWLRTSL